MIKYIPKKALYALSRRLETLPRNHQSLVKALGKNRVIGRHRLNVQIQTVSTCNAKCYYCPYLESWHKANPGIMDEGLYRKIIQNLSHYKLAKFCPYLENEPLIDPSMFDRIEYALTKLDLLLLELSTNASLLDSGKLADLVRIFPKVPHEIWISFHGVDKTSYESIMGLDFETCLSNVLSLVEASQCHNLRVKIRGSGEPVNTKTGAPFWFEEQTYRSFWNNEFNRMGIRKSPEISFFKYHDRAGSISRNAVNFSKVFKRNLNGFYCNRVDQWVHFLYTGELVLCCMDYHRRTVFGDIRDSSLQEIFMSEKFRDLAGRCAGVIESSGDFICKQCISPGG